MTLRLLTEHHLELLSLKRRLHRLVRVCTCQYTTLLDLILFVPVNNSLNYVGTGLPGLNQY